MARRKPKNKKTNPIYYVFCEGSSEEHYIKSLKQRFRLPTVAIKIETKNSLDVRKLGGYFSDKNFDENKDKIFLMYDLDVTGVLEKLQAIEKKYAKNTVLLVSNPCFELWYLLYFKSYHKHSHCATIEILLKKMYPHYKKGKVIDHDVNQEAEAVERAKRSIPYKNPSTMVYKIIEIFKKWQAL